jgi:hypothetical protein
MRASYLAAVVVCLGLVGCDETPAKFRFCDGVGEKNCAIFARFRDFESCEFYKTFYNARCDRVSQPGKIQCITGEAPAVPFSTRCTK